VHGTLEAVPFVEHEDGVSLFWQEWGEGPTVLVAPSYIQHPKVFAALMEALTVGHRIVRYDPRGSGESTRRGPFDMQTDVDDLIAVAEAAAPIAVVMGNGDASNRAIHAAAQRPDLLATVVSLETVPLRPGQAAGIEALVNSVGVLEALVSLMRTDYRTGLSATVQRGNPDMTAEDVRERVDATAAYTDHAAAVGRLEAWIHDDPGDDPQSLGDKLVVVYEGAGAWFPAELTERGREVFPDAQFIKVEGGAVSMPHLTAAAVRAVTGVETPA
jgi:pimeloyl-ACP methyl ester carboxylesterase